MKFKLKQVVLSGSAAAIICMGGLKGYAQEQQPTPGQQQSAPGQQQEPQPEHQQPAPGQQDPGGQQAPSQQVPQALRDDFSDEELEKFVDINMKLAPHQQEGEMKMVKAIKDEGIEAARFNEIMTSRQMNDSTNAGASDEELQKVDAAAQKIMSIQQEVEQEMTKVIEEEGMEPQEFQEMILAYQQSPEVREKVNTLIQEQQTANPGAAPGQEAPRQEAAPGRENPAQDVPAEQKEE
ncbi:MAG TPA: DUF4168 domain-containing protein [Anseongella sp.]|nr:DUF4168 domain-containing protein [Anseongella sp.]